MSKPITTIKLSASRLPERPPSRAVFNRLMREMDAKITKLEEKADKRLADMRSKRGK